MQVKVPESVSSFHPSDPIFKTVFACHSSSVLNSEGVLRLVLSSSPLQRYLPKSSWCSCLEGKMPYWVITTQCHCINPRTKMSALGLRVAVLMQSFSHVQEAPRCDHLQHKNTNPGLGCMNADAGIQSLSRSLACHPI